MAYTEKHGRGYRARWRGTDGRLRSVSGFLSREEAEAYGAAHENEMGAASAWVQTFDARPVVVEGLKYTSGQLIADEAREIIAAAYKAGYQAGVKAKKTEPT